MDELLKAGTRVKITTPYSTRTGETGLVAIAVDSSYALYNYRIQFPDNRKLAFKRDEFEVVVQ